MQENHVPFEDLPNFLKPSVDLFAKEHEYYSDVNAVATGKKGDAVRPDILIK